jgi:hypothetical protein
MQESGRTTQCSPVKKKGTAALFPGSERLQGKPGSAEARGACFTKNTASYCFFLAISDRWCRAWLPAMQTYDGAGIGGSSRSLLHEKHSILLFFLGNLRSLVSCMASCHADLRRSRDRRKLEEPWAYPRPGDETSAVPAVRSRFRQVSTPSPGSMASVSSSRLAVSTRTAPAASPDTTRMAPTVPPGGDTRGNPSGPST